MRELTHTPPGGPGLRVPFLRSLGLRLRDPTVVVAISQTDGNGLFNVPSRYSAKSLCFSLKFCLPSVGWPMSAALRGAQWPPQLSLINGDP